MSRAVRLAIPNKGRLQEPTVALLRDAGLVFEPTERALSVRVRNIDLDLLFVRTEDIVELVGDSTADLGITGRDSLAESSIDLPILAELGYGRCELVAAVPKDLKAEDVEDFAGFSIATAHPSLTAAFFAGHGVDITVIPLHGSVEVAPKLGVADAIVDLVSTGSTLLVNGLRRVGTILESQAVLIADPAALRDRPAELERVATALRAVVAGRQRRYLVLNAPSGSTPRIAQLIPGLESPTVVPLAEDGMVAVHSVVETNDLWNLLPELKTAGARDILVLRIEQLIP